MQEGGEPLHQTKDSHGEPGPGPKEKPEEDSAGPAAPLQTDPQHHVPEHFGELGVRQGQGPQTQVGRRVRDGPQHVLDGVDSLHQRRLGLYQ